MINRLMKKYKYYLYLLIIPLLFPLVVYADDSIDVNCSITNVKNPIELVVDYEIIPDSSNPIGATNEPTEVSLVINKTDNIFNNRIDKKIYVDFTDTNYTEAGMYKYIIQEKNISNTMDFNFTNKQYELYVQVIYDSNGELIKNRYLFGKDLTDNSKKQVSFIYPNMHEEKDVPDIPITGMNVNYLYIILILIIIGLCFIVKGIYGKKS